MKEIVTNELVLASSIENFKGLYQRYYMSPSFVNMGFIGYINLTHFPKLPLSMTYFVYILSIFNKCYRKYLKIYDSVS